MALLILRTAVPSSAGGVVAIDEMARGPSLMNVAGFRFGAHAVELPSGSLCRVWSPAERCAACSTVSYVDGLIAFGAE